MDDDDGNPDNDDLASRFPSPVCPSLGGNFDNPLDSDDLDDLGVSPSAAAAEGDMTGDPIGVVVPVPRERVSLDVFDERRRPSPSDCSAAAASE